MVGVEPLKEQIPEGDQWREQTVVKALAVCGGELAKELEQGTIERQLAKSDLELGLEVLRNPDLLRRNKRRPVLGELISEYEPAA